MKKMIIVVLSLAFSLTACNKNNSKANRIKPGAVNPATTPEAAKDKATTAETDPVDGTKLPDPKLDANTETAPEDSTVTPPAVSAKPGTGTAVQTTPKVTIPSSTSSQTLTPAQPISQGTKISTPTTATTPTIVAPTATTALATSAAEVAQATTGSTSKLAVAGNATLFPYNSMNYIEAKMTTDEQKNRVLMMSVLGVEQAKAVKLALYCYDQKTTTIRTDDVKTNLPVMFLFPKSEALVEIKKTKTSAEDASQESPGFVLGVCDGDENVYDPKALESQNNYEIKKIRSGESHLDYLTLDEKDRDFTDISVTCSNESNVSQKLERKQNDGKKVMNRVTLSQGSKMLFSRPATFKEKNGIEFQTNRKLKQNLVLECE